MKTTTHKSGWLGGVTSLLASAVGLACPACIANSLGLLASLGASLSATERFIRPLLIVLLMVAVVAFVWSAREHRHWWIVATGIVGGVLVYLGRYYLGFSAVWMNQMASWTGTGLLIGTALVNLWLKRRCATCATNTASSNTGQSSCCGKVKS